LTARDFFSDICQVGSWESTCLLYAATSTVGKEDGRLTRCRGTPVNYYNYYFCTFCSVALFFILEEENLIENLKI
jgi:hypothetical protein